MAPHSWKIPRTAAYQAPPSMGFSRWEYWSGLPFPSPGDLPDPGIEPTSLKSLALEGRFFITSATWESHVYIHIYICKRRAENSLTVQWVRLCTSTAGGINSILQASQYGQKKKKKRKKSRMFCPPSDLQRLTHCSCWLAAHSVLQMEKLRW